MVIMKSVTATRMSVATDASIPAATTAMPRCSTPCLAVAEVASQIVIDVFDFFVHSADNVDVFALGMRILRNVRSIFLHNSLPFCECRHVLLPYHH